MKGLLADLKHALRLYWRTPAASVIAVGVLAVGMAFVVAFVSLYVDLVLRPHPGFENAGQMVTIGVTDGRRLTGLPATLIERVADEATSLDAAAGVVRASLRTDAEGDYVTAELVTPDFFDKLQPRLLSGRGFELEDHNADSAPVAVISYRYWQEHFEGRDVLGTKLGVDIQPYMNFGRQGEESEEPELDFRDFRIVGIMAPEMTGTFASGTEIWFPFVRAVTLLYRGPSLDEIRSQLGMQALGIKRKGVSADAVVKEIDSRFGELGDNFRIQPGFYVDAIDGVVRDINVQRDSKHQLELFLAASVLLAVVAAANVSLFLLARAPGRRRELAIRMAVGAPLKRLARQLASEAGLLVIVAALIGMFVSIWLSNFLRGLAFLRQAAWRDVSLFDWRVLGLVGLILLVLTVLVSLAPILGLGRLGIGATSRHVAARPTLAQRIAGTVQVAIAGALAGAAIAFGWYLGSMTLGDPGYAIEGRYVAQYSINTANLTRILSGGNAVEMARNREAIEAIPGVAAAAFGQPVPGVNYESFRSVPGPTDPTTPLRVRMGSIDSHYVDLLGLRLIHGRAPDDGDTSVALVNQAFAREFFGREDVVGEHVPSPSPQAQGEPIIGVLEDLSFEHPAAEVVPIVFTTAARAFQTPVVIRTSLTAAALTQALEGLVDDGTIDGRISGVRSLGDLRRDLLAADRARSFLTIGTAALVVLLAAFGYYGTQRYVVTAGRREYAIRASLGAGPSALSRLVFRRGLSLSLPGLVAGGLFAYIGVAYLRGDFVSRNISPGGITVSVLAGLTLLLLVASLGPARQARRTQPAPLLRDE